MEVMINGEQYVKLTALETDNELLTALELRFDSDAGENLTIREYLHKLLRTLWIEESVFSGKRPFGNIGWEYELYKPLITNDFIIGVVDEDGCVERVDYDVAHFYVSKLIDTCFFGLGRA